MSPGARGQSAAEHILHGPLKHSQGGDEHVVTDNDNENR